MTAWLFLRKVDFQVQRGATENAGVEKSARSKMQGWKRREWKHRHDFAGVENTGVETSGKIDTDAECYAGVCREKNG